MSARSSLAPQLVYRRKPLPESLAPRTKSTSLRDSHRATWDLGVKGKAGLAPQCFTSGLSAAEVPRGTLAWGGFGSRMSISSRRASSLLAVTRVS